LSANLGSRLDQLISDLNMNQGAFAKKLECSPAFISEVLRDLKKPGTDFLIRISTTFNVSLDWLILGVEPRFLYESKLAEIDLEKIKFIALRVELAELASKGSDEAKKVLYELRDDIPNSKDCLQREQLKVQLKERLERLKFVVKMYNQITEFKQLNELSRYICLESIKQFLVNDKDLLERYVNS
jgi:transcriptional regulator with XRE-family HTH domain